MENKLTPELIEKARGAKSAEELLALAKENGMELPEEDAKDHFELLNKSGELSDEELNNVSGGGCHYKDGRLIVTHGNSCDEWVCQYCNERFSWNKYGGKTHACWTMPGGYSPPWYHCDNCGFMVYEHALWLCDNPKKMKN